MNNKDFRYPIKFEDKDKTVLLLDTGHAADDYLNYALKHFVDVLYTQTTSTDSVEIINKFIKNGFYATFEEVSRCINGIQLDPLIQIRFER